MATRHAPDDGIDEDPRGKAWLRAYVRMQTALKAYHRNATRRGHDSQGAKAAWAHYLTVAHRFDTLHNV